MRLRYSRSLKPCECKKPIPNHQSLILLDLSAAFDTVSLISTRWSNGSCTDLRLPGGHLGMDERTPSTRLNLAKTELLVFPATPTLHHDFTIQLGSSTITPSASVRNLGVIFDGQLTFKEHIAKTARSCRFCTTQHQKEQALFKQSMLHNFLSRPLSFLDWTTAMLF